jgi:hypothetical protein
LLFTPNIIYFLSFLCVTLHFIVTEKIQNLTAEAESHTIKLSWTNPDEEDNFNVRYAIEWKDITDGSKNGNDDTNNRHYDIQNLEACVTFTISVSVVYENGSRSEAAITNVKTLPDGKWHVMYRFMTCTCTTSYSELIEYSHQLKLLLQILYI